MTDIENSPFISAAIVTYNAEETVMPAIESIYKYTRRYPVNICVFDNASSDETVSLVKKSGLAQVVGLEKNEGFGAGHNEMLKHSMGKYHFVINPDITVSSDVISDIADFMEENPDIVMCMPKILNSDGTEQKLPKEIPTFKRMFLGRLAPLSKRFKKIRDDYIWADRDLTGVTDIDFCSGCFFCIRSEAFKKLGGFDERFFMYLEDADMTLRAKKLGRVVIAPQFSVTHLWERESAKSLKYMLIHIDSAFKFIRKKRERKK